MGRMLDTIRKAVPTPTSSDAELLDQFVASNDEAAFEALVRRHGPMVLRLCRSILHGTQDAEDAFQATFIVLMRRAGSIGQKDLLGHWLYKVAYRVALKARARSSKASEREKEIAGGRSEEVADPRNSGAAFGRDVRPVLDEEIARLPDKYRAPVVLSYLEGKTTDETAQLLGWSRGTVATRLSRARDLLRDRLSRRGLTLTAVGVLALLNDRAVMALPVRLLDATVRGNTLLAQGNQAGNSLLSAKARQLANGPWLSFSRLKLAAVAAILVIGGVALASSLFSRDDPERATPTPGTPAPEDKPFVMIKWQAVDVLRESGNPKGKRIIGALALAPGGKMLAAGGNDRKVKVWDLTGSKQVRVLNPHRAEISALAFTPDGKVLASASTDSTLRVWDLVNLKWIEIKQAGKHALALRFLANGQLISAQQDGSVTLWDVRKRTRIGTVRQTTARDVSHAAIAPDGKQVVLAYPDGVVKVWNYDTLRETKLADDWPTQGLAFTSINQAPVIFAPGASGRLVRLWSLAGKHLATVQLQRKNPAKQGEQVEIPALAFTPDTNLMAWSAVNGDVALWKYHFERVSEQEARRRQQALNR